MIEQQEIEGTEHMAKVKFEKAFKELQDIVAALEQGDLPLDECLARYEAGVKALRTCRQILDEAEKKIEMLTKDESGALKAKPFEPEIEADEEEKK